MSPAYFASYMQERQMRCAEEGRRAGEAQRAAELQSRAQEEQQRQKGQQEAREAAEREAREAQAKIARAETERRYQAAVSEQETTERERGYRPITFEDFVLDGKELAGSDAKVAIRGMYIKLGEVEMLFPSVMAVLMAQQTFKTDTGIGLLTEDADRSIRKYFLDCRNNFAAAAQGCQVTVLGRATMCERTTLVSSSSIPRVAVDDGWNIAPPR
jgi:hypothetical protein